MVLRLAELTEEEKQRINPEAVKSLLDALEGRYNRGHYAKSDKAEIEEQIKEYRKMLAEN